MEMPKRWTVTPVMDDGLPSLLVDPVKFGEYYKADDMDRWLTKEVLPVLKTVVHQWKYYHLRATGGEAADCEECGMLHEDTHALIHMIEANTDAHGNTNDVRGGDR